MGTLSGNAIKDTFESLLKLESNDVTSTLKTVEDGGGVDTALKLSTDTVEVNGTLSFTTAPTTDSAELTALLIDGSNNVVKRELDSTAFTSGTTNSFETIAVSGQTDVVADSSTDTLTLVEGSGIEITTNATTDTITITNNSNVFKTIAVSGQTDIVADTLTDTLTFAEGEGITITTDATTDTMTIAASEFGNPMMLIRPNGNLALSGTPTTPALASIDNTDDFGSYEVNDDQAHLSIATKGIKIEKDGLIRIDIAFIVDVTSSNTEITINVGRERPDGATFTSIQEIERSKSTTGLTAIGYSLFTAARADDVYIYRISVSGGGGELTTASAFVVTKLS